MSSHDCMLEGVLRLKPEVTEAQVKNALAPVLERTCSSYEEEVETGSITFDQGELAFAIAYSGTPGWQYDDEARAVVDAITPLAFGGQTIERRDFDTGDSTEHCVPLFIGTELERKQAQILYGIERMQEWVEPILGKAVCQAVRDQLLRTARGE